MASSQHNFAPLPLTEDEVVEEVEARASIEPGSEHEMDAPSSPSSSGYAGETGSTSATSGSLIEIEQEQEHEELEEQMRIQIDEISISDSNSNSSWIPGKRHLDEDDASISWRKRKKHFFILSHSGKPIYSRYGDEHKLAGFSATLQAIISFVENGGDSVKLVRAGKHQVVFLVKGPIYLVCISCTEEPYESLRGQLELIYGQMLVILTKSVDRCFEKNPKFDMIPLLGGTDIVFSSLIHMGGGVGVEQRSAQRQREGMATGYHQPSSIEEVRTLWIGDLQYWVDENYLTHCFAHTGEVVSIKIIRNKMTGQPEGYGFVEFVSHAAAERVLQSYNGTQMPGTEQTFRLNWASFGIGERRPDAGPEHSIFVGDLAPDVTDYLLQETFRAHYPSVRGAKVVTDPTTSRSKGYGFVKFSDESERNRAMTEMNGVYCSTRPMRISAATPKKTTAFQHPYAAAAAAAAPAPKAIYPVPAYTTPVNTVPPEYDVNNTTIFVGNLDLNVSEEELKQNFLQFGDIVSVKIHAGKGCGFVQFGTRASAEEAIQKMQGKMIGQQVIRVSWGRTLTARQDLPGGWGQQMDPSQWSAYYGYGQGYEAYAYGATHDPSSYAYAGYAQYPQQVEGAAQDVSSMSVPTMEQKEELYDPMAMPDVDKLNAAYLSIHGNAILGRSLWHRTHSASLQQA